MGWGYCPTNIPQWNQKYKVGVALLDNDGKAVKTFVDHNSDLSTWLKGADYEYDTEIDLTGVDKGTYHWAVALVDVTDGNRPGLEMAVDADKTVNGWLPVSKLTIK